MVDREREGRRWISAGRRFRRFAAALVLVSLAGGLFPFEVLHAQAVSLSGTYYSDKNSTRPVRKSTRFIILHTTEGSARGALEKLQRNGECHYVVDTDGRIYRIIDRRRVAFHAGRSMWNGVTDLDTCSIGIEIVGYHDKPFTTAQYTALKTLVGDLKRSYKITDDRVLTHSMVAYGTPNRWQKRSHRGRKRCCMLMANPANRRKIGVMSKPAYDPDLRAGRLVDADPELTRILYGSGSSAPSVAAAPSVPKTAPPSPSKTTIAPVAGGPNVIGPGRSAWDIARDLYNAETTQYRFPDGSVKNGRQITKWTALPSGTVVTVGQTMVENPSEGLLVLGKDGNSASELAGDEARSSTTFYFLPGQKYRRGTELTTAQFASLPVGTQMLVGYAVGGPVAGGRPAFAVCGPRWNRADTFYLTPKGSLVAGDSIGERSIPEGTMVFYRK
jgi:N-acetylmuramoyl-L-alanine amidase